MKAIATGVLTIMITGLITNALALWKNQGIIENRVSTVEEKQKIQDNTNKELTEKMYDIHWYLIKSRGVNVPPKESK